ncbi:uncharacterized protein KY384_000358 [Bacidia gigantensis]|uniref:uncharacterized protein n=1 Tax=Bacidia gigantensis TaxID=2732470 RepID=UPI001D04A683|nr:uncharacterized protein KY384_000358 [Bacidia gigantensis]KAG8526365.1 hypothetical protein KY384_000358 [Bacidia gigantensis]
MLVGALLLALISVARADNKWYAIWPTDSANKAANQKITDDLTSKVKDNLFVSKSGLGNHYWYALLSDDDKKHYDGFDGVRHVALPEANSGDRYFKPITQQSRSLHKRDPPESQKPAPDHLKIISQANGQKFSDLDGYYYDKSAGDGIKIYIIDTGLNKHDTEFPNQISWLHAGPFPDNVENDSDTSPDEGHGTCMASSALGVKDGVAKKAVLTMVRADTHTSTDKIPDGTAISPERWIDSLAITYDDIVKNNLKGKAVVSMSWGVDQKKEDNAYSECIRDAFKFLLNELLKLDVPQIIAAGQNKGLPGPGVDPDLITTYPALLGVGDTPDIPGLTVVASVDKDGDYEAGSRRDDKKTIAAMGDGAECAKSSGSGEYITSGTSPATAQVAGLLAYFMKLGKSGADARTQLFDKAYKRSSGNDPASKVAWNLINTRDPGSASTPANPTASSGSTPNGLQCKGIGGDLWVLSRDQAAEAARQFCGQDVSPKEYYQGSANYLSLEVANVNDKTKPMTAAPDCANTFISQVIDGCDGSDKLNNPFNYKFGGTFTTPDGWQFTLTPKAQKTKDESCNVKYKFLFDDFEVQGKYFPDAVLGANGEGLQKQISGCGKLENWNFQRHATDQDNEWQWTASGRLPIGTKSCVGSATRSAGGNDNAPDGCKGAG